MQIETWPIDKVTPYPDNPRVIPEEAIEAVRTSLQQYGWRQPLVVDASGVLVAGHTRLLAAEKLGMTEVPVHIATELTPEQVRAYRLADNQTGVKTGWDLDGLSDELRAIMAVDLDLYTGFSTEEIDLLVSGILDNDPDENKEGDPDDIPTEGGMVELRFMVPREYAKDVRQRIDALIAGLTGQAVE